MKYVMLFLLVAGCKGTSLKDIPPECLEAYSKRGTFKTKEMEALNDLVIQQCQEIIKE